MKLLALETSTEYCSVALYQDGVISERFELVGQKHSELLIDMIAAVLHDAQLSLVELDGIAYGSGPGSFTGVRIACGTTQGLALGANLRVYGVCTLQALAQASGHSRVIAALDARMGEIYHAVYELQQGEWIVLSEPSLCKAEEAPQVEGEGWFGAGSGFATYSDALQTRYNKNLQGVDGKAVPHAAAVVALAASAFAAGKGQDAALAQPLYLRNKVALKTAEREQLAREKNA
ncbi:MAG: tRNA (adenosine(37)-N6)-threonylcarbamoyltransferase complex dimerization subunit type 1 TsaB [Gallionella sp.]|nr:tRNA (adenosine(37)-N6)-threonylcarbamoyltransferase complex dimerization subunit type 1 TsaB [Gallionella sp.]